MLRCSLKWLDLILFALIIYSTYYSISFNSSLSDSYLAITRLKHSWEKSPIKAFSFSKDVCPKSKEMKQIYIWPGTITGCDCTSISYFSNHELYHDYAGKLFSGSCNTNMTSVGCAHIYSIGPRALSKWRAKNVCIERLEGNYESLVKIPHNSSCPTNYKRCGIIDTLNNILCIDEKTNCPLNSITKEENSKKTSIIHNQEKPVLSDIGIFDRNICVNVNEKEFYESSYPLFSSMGCFSSFQTEKYENYRFNHLDEYPKKNFYKDNSIIDIIYRLPKYPELYESVNAYLNGETYIGFKQECLSQFSDYSLITLFNNLQEKSESFQSYSSYINILLCFGIFVYFMILFHRFNIMVLNSSIFL